jgi:hypothetical protein
MPIILEMLDAAMFVKMNLKLKCSFYFFSFPISAFSDDSGCWQREWWKVSVKDCGSFLGVDCDMSN